MGSKPIYQQKAEILNFLMVYRFAMYRQTAGELQAGKGQCSNWGLRVGSNVKAMKDGIIANAKDTKQDLLCCGNSQHTSQRER